jgi:signal transduction histidine kinase
MAACVVSNLVGNAVRNTDKGRIDVRLEADRIVVQDTGSGIAARDLQQIFERRYRSPHSGGLGLGLYLVKRICDRLGWRVEVQSAPGAGARFDVLFSPIT